MQPIRYLFICYSNSELWVIEKFSEHLQGQNHYSTRFRVAASDEVDELPSVSSTRCKPPMTRKCPCLVVHSSRHLNIILTINSTQDTHQNFQLPCPCKTKTIPSRLSKLLAYDLTFILQARPLERCKISHLSVTILPKSRISLVRKLTSFHKDIHLER